MSTDRIEKATILDAPCDRVWDALTDVEKFGSWFGVALTGTFTPGTRVEGRVTEPGYEHVSIELTVGHVEPEQLLSFRWHPYAIDPGVDYSSEPTTLVEIRLTPILGGTRVAVAESGFDALPPERRAEAVAMNDDGWNQQMKNLARYLASPPEPQKV